VDNGEVVNTATADSDQAGPVSDQVFTPIDEPLGPGLGVNKTLTDAPDPIVVGSVLTYTVTALNSGAITQTNVVVSDPLLTPDSIACASVAPSATCELVGTYQVTAADVSNGEIENTGTAVSDQSDPISDTLITPVGADVWVDKVLVTPGPYTVGQSVSFLITVGNDGPLTATQVIVEDIPVNLTLTGVAPGVGVDCPGGVFPCTIASLASGGTVEIGVTATIDAEGPFSNSVAVDAEQPDPDMDNNADAADQTAGGPGTGLPIPVSIPGPGPAGLGLLALLALLVGWRAMRREAGARH
jgi:large repetitive protein